MHPKTPGLILCLAGSILLAGPVAAVEPATRGDERKTRPLPPAAEPAMDPVLRAVLIGLAASLLREAAASPDPMSAFGEALERKLLLVLRSPEFARLADQLVGHAAKDVPLELREPLQLFALSMLRSLRRDMLESLGPRPRHAPHPAH